MRQAQKSTAYTTRLCATLYYPTPNNYIYYTYFIPKSTNYKNHVPLKKLSISYFYLFISDYLLNHQKLEKISNKYQDI